MIGQLVLTLKQYPIYFSEAVPEHPGQLHFMVVNLIHAIFLNPLQTGVYSGNAHHIAGTVLEPVGILVQMHPMSRPDSGSAGPGMSNLNFLSHI